MIYPREKQKNFTKPDSLQIFKKIIYYAESNFCMKLIAEMMNKTLTPIT